MAVMRTSLLPGLVGALTLNQNRQQERVRLFEVGRVFHQGKDGPEEALQIAGVVAGTASAEQWGEKKRRADFFDLKGDVESLLGLTNAPESFRAAPAEVSWLHPGQSATLWRGNRVAGHLGAIHPERARLLGLDGDVYAFELEVEAIQKREVPRAAAVSRFPSVRRDIAVIVPESVPYARRAFGRPWGRSHGTPCFRSILWPESRFWRKVLLGLILQNGYRTLMDGRGRL
jgi:phenylalanyl-tRNA synthetase beta chain